MATQQETVDSSFGASILVAASDGTPTGNRQRECCRDAAGTLLGGPRAGAGMGKDKNGVAEIAVQTVFPVGSAEHDAERADFDSREAGHDDEQPGMTRSNSGGGFSTISQQASTIRESFRSPAMQVLMVGTILASCAGAVDVITFLQMDHFVSHVTGTVAHLGMRVEGNHSGRNSPAELRRACLLVVSFVGGAILCGLIIAKNELRFGKGLYGLALVLNSLLLFISTFFADFHYEVAIYSAAAACGLQNGMCTMLFGAVVRTTHVTGLATDLGTTLGRLLAGCLRRRCKRSALDALDNAELEVDLKKVRVFCALGFGFIFGTVGGSYLQRWFGVNALLFPATITGTGGGLYLCFQKKVETTMKKLEMKKLSADVMQVEGILRRARTYLVRVTSQRSGDSSVCSSSQSSESQQRGGCGCLPYMPESNDDNHDEELHQEVGKMIDVIMSVEQSIENFYGDGLPQRSRSHSNEAAVQIDSPNSAPAPRSASPARLFRGNSV